MTDLTPMQRARRDIAYDPILAEMQRACSHPQDEQGKAYIDGYDVEQCMACMFIHSEKPATYS